MPTHRPIWPLALIIGPALVMGFAIGMHPSWAILAPLLPLCIGLWLIGMQAL